MTWIRLYGVSRLVVLIHFFFYGGCACGSTSPRDAGDDASDGMDAADIEDTEEEGDSLCGNGTIDGDEECDDGNDVAWDGCTRCRITEFQVNNSYEHNEHSPCIGLLPEGDFLAVWVGWDDSGLGVYARLFENNDMLANTEFQVNTYIDCQEQYPAIATYDLGAVISWSDFGDPGCRFGIYAQAIDQDGTFDGSEVQVSTMRGLVSDVAMESDGSFVVTWEAGNIYARRYSDTGTPLGDAIQVNSYPSSNHDNPSVAGTADGRFVVVWQNRIQDGSYTGVFGQLFDADGSTYGDEFQINVYTLNQQENPDVAMGPDGRFVVVWDGEGEDDDIGVYAREYDSTGVPLDDPFLVNTYTDLNQSHAAVDLNASGSYIVVWQSRGHDSTTDDYGIFAQRYDWLHTPVGDEFQVNVFTDDDQDTPDVQMDDAGYFIVVWRSAGDQDGSLTGIFAQRYSDDGNLLGIFHY